MIAYLRGSLARAGTDEAVIEVGGVGYLVHIPLSTREKLPQVGQEVKLFTYMHVREDAISLFGFATPEDQNLFVTLLTVSGVGPKVALSVVSSISVDGFKAAVLNEDTAALTRISGIGKKVAARIIVELRDRLGARGSGLEPQYSFSELSGGPEGEAVQALMALGYTYVEASRAVTQAKSSSGEGAGVEMLIRNALRSVASE